MQQIFKPLRFPLLLLAVFALLAALWAGLLRLGWAWPLLVNSLPISHGPLMVSGFFGTLISLERAVALNRKWAYLGPLASGAGGLLLATNIGGMLGPILLTLGSLGMLIMFGVLLRQRNADDMRVMTLGAASWFAGNLLWLAGRPVYQVVWWWVAFLVLTIAGERLELGRMLRLSQFSRRAYLATVLVVLAGLLLQLLNLDLGTRLVGLGMLLLALWLMRYDIARYTVRQQGLTRYIAVCLLSGYFWLAVSGGMSLVFGAESAGPRYDMMLHAVLVGFVFGMVFGHAPIIFPSVLGLPINYRAFFYTPLILLQASLLLRIAGGLSSSLWARQWGGLLNALAVLFFLFIIAPFPWRRKGFDWEKMPD